MSETFFEMIEGKPMRGHANVGALLEYSVVEIIARDGTTMREVVLRPVEPAPVAPAPEPQKESADAAP